MGVVDFCTAVETKTVFDVSDARNITSAGHDA